MNMTNSTYFIPHGGTMEKQIGEIKKTPSVNLKVRLTEFKGRNFLDVRDFFRSKSATMDGPTKKGITLDIKMIPQLVSLLEIVETEALGQ